MLKKIKFEDPVVLEMSQYVRKRPANLMIFNYKCRNDPFKTKKVIYLTSRTAS